MSRFSSRSVGVLFLVCCSANAQDLPAGPERGKSVPPLKVFDVTGEHKDKEINYAAERKEKSTVYAFVRADAWDRPMARLLRELDKAFNKDGEETRVVAVWLTDDAEKTKEYLPKAQQSLQFQATALTYFPGGKLGPEGWGINGDAHLIVVVANKGKVAATFGYRSVNETDAVGVLKALREARAGQ